MKIGIMSDVHGNIKALKAVIEKFEKENVEKIICCGDVIGIGPKPEEVVKTLIENNEKLIIVKGNHEDYLLKGLPKKIHDEQRLFSLEEMANHKWIHDQISEQSKAFLSDIPISQDIEIEGKKIHVVHYPMGENGKYKKHIKKATLEECENLYDDMDADIILYGHTHLANMNKGENTWYINPGSVGCPIGTGVANAGILTLGKEIEYEQLKIDYDVEDVIEEIERIQYPHYKAIIKLFYGNKDHVSE